MSGTYHEIYIHLIWSTKNREELINEEIENIINNIIIEKTKKFKSQIIAKGYTTNHIHLLLSISPETAISRFVKEIKGATSFFVNHNTKNVLYWQDGYGVLSVSKSGLSVVKNYVNKQKDHHMENINLIKILEKFE